MIPLKKGVHVFGPHRKDAVKDPEKALSAIKVPPAKNKKKKK